MELQDLLEKDHVFTSDREDWFPSLKDAIKGVDAKSAAWKPKGGAVNSIWETVHHILYFQERLLYQLTERLDEFRSVGNNDQTFLIDGEDTERSWGKTIEKVERIQQEVSTLLRQLSPEDLQKNIRNIPACELISGITRHNAYHIGQIIFLRKLQGSWPSSRMFQF